MANTHGLDPVWLERIAESLKGMEFGSLEIKVHHGRIMQIDRIERIRYESLSEVTEAPVARKSSDYRSK